MYNNNNNIKRVRLTTKIHLGFSHPIDLVARVLYTGTASTSFGYFDILLTGARKKITKNSLPLYKSVYSNT